MGQSWIFDTQHGLGGSRGEASEGPEVGSSRACRVAGEGTSRGGGMQGSAGQPQSAESRTCETLVWHIHTCAADL